MLFKDWIYRRGGPDKLAPRLGVTPHTIRYWLRGTTSPTMKTIARIHQLSRGRVTFASIVAARKPRVR